MNSTALAHVDRSFDVEAARRQFPILARMVRGKPLAYLDNGASAQRPLSVIAAVDDYERHHHANIHRGVHTLSQEATALYEGARDRLAQFINARSRNEIIFVRGTTEAINLVTQSYARPLLKAGDEVLITHLEHHANIVPWQMVCEQTGASLVVAPMDANGEVHLDAVVASDVAADQDFRLRARIQRAGYGIAGQALGGRGQGARDHHPGGWRSGRFRTWLSMCRIWAAISTRFPATRCMARPAWACSMDANSCWIACRLGKAAAK